MPFAPEARALDEAVTPEEQAWLGYATVKLGRFFWKATNLGVLRISLQALVQPTA